jgi:hypothetical protein
MVGAGERGRGPWGESASDDLADGLSNFDTKSEVGKDRATVRPAIDRVASQASGLAAERALDLVEMRVPVLGTDEVQRPTGPDILHHHFV